MIDEWTVLETFKSKKNHVFKIEHNGKEYVVKRFSDEFIQGMETEKEVLRRCEEEGLPVPEVIDHWDNILLLEYLPGKSCKEVFDSSKEKRKKVLSGIAGWLSGFHKNFDFQRRRGDSILANFILSGNNIYGIDFEESVKGDHSRDLGDLCTSLLRLRPVFTESRFRMVDYFLDEYFNNLDRERNDISSQIAHSLKHYAQYNPEGDVMERWAKKIQEKGLSNILKH